MECRDVAVSRIAVATPWAVYEGDYEHRADEQLSDALQSLYSGRYIRLTNVIVRSGAAREGLPAEAPFILINLEHAGVITPISESGEEPPAFARWEQLRRTYHGELGHSGGAH